MSASRYRRAAALLLALLPLAAWPGEVLVLGGTGQLGSEVVRALLGAGHRVAVLARPGSDRSRLAGLTVTWVTGDLLVAEDVDDALASRGYEAVVDASARGAASDTFYPTAMANLVAAAQAHGKPRIILHGSVGAGDNAREFPQAPFGRMAATLAAKGEAEARLRASGLDYAIIRNGILQPAGTLATGKAVLSDDTRLMRRVTRADLARLTVQCLADPGCFGRTWHAVDPTLPAPERYR